jgi:DNA-binding CsgD family transcriptional regulator
VRRIVPPARSVKTVAAPKARAREKLGLNRRADTIAHARQSGWLSTN